MAFIRWEEKYRINVKKIDEQHKRLFEILNVLHNAMLNGKSKKVIGKALAELAEYTISHFTDEEEYMKQYDYPGYTLHKKEHDELLKQITEVLRNFDSGKGTLSMSTMYFLKDWLYKHIINTDLLYANYFRNRGMT